MYMIKASTNNGIAYITAGTKNAADELLTILTDFAGENLIDAACFESGAFPFERLPEDIQNEVMDTLKAFPSTNVEHYNGKFHESPGTAILARYPTDFYFCGTYYAKDIYTEEERRRNYIESFGYEPGMNRF